MRKRGVGQSTPGEKGVQFPAQQGEDGLFSENWEDFGGDVRNRASAF